MKRMGSRNTVTAAKKKKRALKKGILIILSAFAVLAILCGILALVLHFVRRKPETAPPVNRDVTGKAYINYYEPDYAADIFKESAYLALDRSIRYTVQGEASSYSYVLSEHSPEALTEGGRFFLTYFDAVTHGNYEAYHGFFTDEYAADPTGFEKHPTDRVFPMQRLYDMRVTELYRTEPGDTAYIYRGEPVVYGVYEVRYKIRKNDGEFRVDLPSDAEMPLIFELMTQNAGTENELTLIRDIYRYEDIETRKE